MLIGDSNTGWTSHQALRVAGAVKDVDVYIEQPCPTYRECLVVRCAHSIANSDPRNHTQLPFVLDEVVDTVHTLLDVARDGSADVVNIKVAAGPLRSLLPRSASSED